MLSHYLSVSYKNKHCLLALCLAAMVSGCAANNGSAHSPVLVAAASDLTQVSRPLASAFERATGLQAVFGFGSSGQLEQQIRQGASFDIYAPAARSFCQALEHDGLAEAPDTPYALGRLVAWSKSLKLTSLDQLTQTQITRVAIANPGFAPYGAAAQQALQKAALWKPLQPKLIYAENVAQALQMAETGNVEVSLVAMSLVQGDDGFILTVDPRLYSPVEQAAVVLKDSTNKAAARAFLNFLRTPEARQILTQYGFTHP